MKNKILLPILLLTAMTMVACNQGGTSSENPGTSSETQLSSQQDSSSEQGSSQQGTSSQQQGTSSQQQSSSSQQQSSSSQASSSSAIQYGVAINNKAQLTDGWYKGTTRSLDLTLTPAANALQEIQRKNLVITSSDPEVVAITGLGLTALKKGPAKITVKYHDVEDTVDVNILSNSAIDKYGTQHEGTLEDPFTNEDAVLVANAANYEKEDYYIRGKVQSFYHAAGV